MKTLGKYSKSFKLGLQSAMEYRADFLMSLLSTVLPTVIQIFLWTAIYTNSNGSIVYGYSFSQMLTYVLMAGVVSKLVSSGVEWDVMTDIRDGGLSKFLVKPVDYFLYRISCFLGQKIFQLGVVSLILACTLAVVNLKFGLSVELERMLVFVPVIFLSLTLNLLIAFIISLLAFWITEAWAAFIILSLLLNIASGGVFPLDIFGEEVLAVLNLLPFKYIIFFPINIINGKLGFADILSGMAVQCAWIGILAVLTRLGWKVGMKKYVAVGG